MKQEIIDIINDKAARKLAFMIESKAKSYRAMIYAGIRVAIDGVTLKQVTEEIGYSSISAISKLVGKWNTKIAEGDIIVHRIVVAYNKLLNRKHRPQRNILLDSEEKGAARKHDASITKNLKRSKLIKKTKPKGRWCLGFWISEDDERFERKVKREAILFMQKYGAGRQPRMNGEYYPPGCNPKELDNDNSEWLPLKTAALYCGCSESKIEHAGQIEEIAKRAYKKNKGRNYYEYLISDLNEYIKNHKLQ